jgi:hypothetical protein
MSGARSRDAIVFVSHSSEDRAWAESVCEALEQQGIHCWIAPRDIRPGTEWGAAIVEGIDLSQIMVLIFSAHANDSRQVRREVERAISKGLSILPLRIEDVAPRGAMEYALSNTHWLDAFAEPDPNQLSHLTDAVTALLDLAERQPASSKTAPPGNTTPAQSGPVRQVRPQPGRPRRVLRIAAGAVVGSLLVLAAIGLFARASQQPTIQGDIQDHTGEIDEELLDASQPLRLVTPQFQGRWLAFYEQTPLMGSTPPHLVALRNHTWTIRDSELTSQFQIRGGKKVAVKGKLFLFEGEGLGNQIFSFRFVHPRDERRTVWLGIYDYRDDVLSVCYREATGPGQLDTRPTAFPGPQDRDVWFLKFRRLRGPG